MQHLDVQVYIVIKQILMLVLLGITGFIAGKTKYLPNNSGIILSGVVIKLTAPILIFTTLASYKFSDETLKDGMWIFTFGLIFILIAFMVSILTSNWLKMPQSTSNIFRVNSMFGNIIFLAFPLLDTLFPGKGIVYAIFYNIANDIILWTLGVYLLNKQNTKQWKDNIKHLVNGNTIAFVSGIILSMGFKLQYLVGKYPTVQKVYNLMFETFNPLGKTTIYLSMIFIGLILSQTKIEGLTGVLKRYPIFILSFIKLLLIPITALVVLFLFGKTVDPFVKTIVVLQLAMPCATIIPGLAAEYKADYKFATECVLFTTLIGAFTLPFMVYMLKIFS